jgi:hypothetical protein
MADIVRSLGRFPGPVVAVGAMAQTTARSVAAAVQEIGGTYVGAARDGPDATLIVSGPAAPAAEELWKGSGLRTSAAPELDATAAPVLALLRLAWTDELTAAATKVTDAARAAGLADQVADLFIAPASFPCADVTGELRRMFSATTLEGAPHERTVSPVARPDPRATGKSTDRPGLLRSLLRRPDDELTLDEQLAQWRIVLEPDESVTWFGACSSDAGHCFLVLTGQRVWRIQSDGTAVGPPRQLREIISVTHERHRLTVTAADWSLEVRGLAANRELDGLRSAFARAPGGQARR